MISDSPQPKRSSGAIILKLALPEWRSYLVAFLLVAATNVMEIFGIRLTALAIEAVSHGTATILTVLAIMGVAFAVLVLRWLNRTWSFVPGRKIERRLRTMIFKNVIGLSQDSMDEHRTGDLVSRIINDVTDIRMVLGSGFLQITNTGVAYFFTILTMLFLAPQLAVAALLPFIPFVLLGKKLTAMTHQRSRESQEALGTLSSAVEEAVGGIEVIKSYTAEGWQAERFAAVNDRNYNAETARTWPESLFVAMMGAVVWIGIASIHLGIGFVKGRGIGPGVADIVTFILLLTKLVWPTVALGWIMNVIQRGLAAAKRVQDFVDIVAQSSAKNQTVEISRDSRNDGNVGSAIEFKHVNFRYPVRSMPTIAGMNLAIREGEWVGIVGPTASGKTTVARLIAGLRTPTEGDVSIGGNAVSTLDARTRRRRVHLATQIPTLFSMSIAENLRLALPDDVVDLGVVGDVGDVGDGTKKTFAELIDDVAFSSDFSLMPEGFESEIGERGLLLSGGQRQRLSLARALLANPDVLILDDVLSAVDLTTELKILDGITKRRRGRTTVFITHRLLLLSRLDRVLVIEDGRISADGNLASALEQSAWLRATFEADRLEASLDADEIHGPDHPAQPVTA